MLDKDIKLVFKAIEFLNKGVDIETLTLADYNKFVSDKTNHLVLKAPSNTFTMKPDADAAKLLSLIEGFFVTRNVSRIFISTEEELEDAEKTTIVDVNLQNVVDIMNILIAHNITEFSGVPKKDYDKEYITRLAAEKASYNLAEVEPCPMMTSLTKDNTRLPLQVLLSVHKYAQGVYDNINTVFESEDSSLREIKSLQGGQIVDNRLYIPVKDFHLDQLRELANCDIKAMSKMKYIVVSKNPYDFFFCSQGSDIQTCYSLTSTYRGGYGFMQFSAVPGVFIVYGTSGRDNSQTIISGQKWSVPEMLFRCWGWLNTDDEVLLDKIYLPNTADSMRPYLNRWLTNWFPVTVDTRHDTYSDLKYAKELKKAYSDNKYRFYSDSVVVTTSSSNSNAFKFRVVKGNRDTIGTISAPFESASAELKKISQISPSFKACADYNIIYGKISNIKKCPITNLPITEEEDESVYSKFFKDTPLPNKSLLVVTYDSGYWRLDACTQAADNSHVVVRHENSTSGRTDSRFYFMDRFSSITLPMRTFKEQMKSLVKHTGYDCILLRCVEQDKVTFIKYRGY